MAPPPAHTSQDRERGQGTNLPPSPHEDRQRCILPPKHCHTKCANNRGYDVLEPLAHPHKSSSGPICAPAPSPHYSAALCIPSAYIRNRPATSTITTPTGNRPAHKRSPHRDAKMPTQMHPPQPHRIYASTEHGQQSRQSKPTRERAFPATPPNQNATDTPKPLTDRPNHTKPTRDSSFPATQPHQ